MQERKLDGQDFSVEFNYGISKFTSWFPKHNNFLWVCWLLDKNLTNFDRLCTIDLETVDYFFPKGHSKQTSNFSFISSLKILGGATKQDVLQFATLRYFLQLYSIFFNLMSSFNLSITYLVCHIQFWLHSTQCLQIMIYQDYTCCFTSCLFWLLWSIKWFMFSQTVSTKKLFKKHSKRILHLGILLKKDLMYSI